MGLKEHIAKLGDAQAAKRYRITERAARSYRMGVRRPKPETALRMVKLSKGELTLASIYQ
jgi:hypothetical protein